MRLILIYCFAVLVSFCTLGQKYSFVTYSTEQGLPQSQVTGITQDEQGYLWIGTLGGLAKFGGNKFTTYSSNEGLLNNRVTSLDFFENTLWIGQEGGVSYMKDNKLKCVAFEGVALPQSERVSKILRFKGKILVCAYGGGLFELKDLKLVKIKLPFKEFGYERIRSAYVYNDQIYLATRKGILVSNDTKNFSIVEWSEDISFSDIYGRNDEIVFASYGDGVYLMNMKSGVTMHYESDQLKHKIDGCYIDQSSMIWLNTREGVVRIDQNGNTSLLNNSNGLPVNRISCFYDDKDGNIWLGSQGKGIFRFPGETFKYYDQDTGFPTDLFITGFQDNKGDYYYGTFDQGVLKKSVGGKIEAIKNTGKMIWASINNVYGKHWFGAQIGLVEIDENGNSKTYYQEINKNVPGKKITAFYKISNNSMYVGGSRGVSLYANGEFTKLGSKKKDNTGTVRDIEMLNNTLYCASNLGLLKYHNDEFAVVKGADQIIFNVEVDENGALWYGTEEGLYRMFNGEIKRVELLENPGSNNICFLNYRKGKLYVGTNNGLFILSDLNAAKQKIERFGIDDGIVDLETNLNSGFFDLNEDFWFGTASGLVCYHEIKSLRNQTNPQVSVTSILLNYETFDYSEYSEELTEKGIPKELILPYSKNNLIFELDGISLTNHKGLRYQFWLEGLRDNWSTPVENPTITFTSLPAGSYILHVRCVDIDGQFSDETHLPFRINQAIYKTWWFMSLCALIIGGVTLFIFRFRLKRIDELNKKEKLGYLAKLQILEQQSLNASMNRHFTFNALNSIQYFINTQDKASANKYLTNFAKLIRKNLDSVTKEGNAITLEEELERLKLYLSLESMRFKDRFDFEINTNGIETDEVLIPPMIMQPFVENSIIHGILPNEKKKGHIKIDISLDKENLCISIHDNGIGVDFSLANKTTSGQEYRSQGMEITSKRIELIRKNSESEISLVGPIQILNNDGSINGTRVLINLPLSHLDI